MGVSNKYFRRKIRVVRVSCGNGLAESVLGWL